MFGRSRQPAREPEVDPDTIVHTAKGRVVRAVDSNQRAYFHVAVRKEDGTFLSFQASYGVVDVPLARVGDYVELTYNLQYGGTHFQLLTFKIDYARSESKSRE